MSLSVTSAPGALALLQALAPQPAPKGANPAAPDPTTTPSVSVTSAFAREPFATAEGVSQALTLADAAGAAGRTIMGLLQQMQATAGQAAEPSASSADRAGLDVQFQAGAAQIAPTLAAATMGGVNLVDGSSATGLKIALGAGATASLTPVDLSLGGSTLGLSDASLATPGGAASTHARLGAALGVANSGLSILQAQADQISAHAGFVQTLGQALALPELASPDQDGGDSVRLLALQVSQQLSGQSSAIANPSPQSILSLFRS